MKILYNPANGAIFYAVPDRDWFYFSHTTNIPLSTLVIDELAPNNQPVCQDLRSVVSKRDVVGLGKYYVNASGQLTERLGWQEEVLP